ncbi:MAG: PHP domain-containing protein, partial [Petrotogales bacterium]
EIQKVLVSGNTKTSVMMENGLQIDIRVVNESSFGAALQYFTGSKEHNIKVRKRAKQLGWTLNEYRLADEETGEKIAGENEKEIYNKLGYQYIPPELRDDVGEHEAALNDEIPELIQPEDIKGDLHIHSDFSDGNATIPQLVEKGLQLNYDYIAITDHLRAFGDSLTVDGVQKRNAIIRALNKKYGEINILNGVEVDIMSNGELYNYDKFPFEEMDVVIGAIHQKISDPSIIERLETAFQTGLIDILAHPTGRVIGRREGNIILTPEKLGPLLAKYGIVCEINALPQRLDLRSSHIRKVDGVKFAIGSDAHGTKMMEYTKTFGVGTARRGWLSKDCLLAKQKSLNS